MELVGAVVFREALFHEKEMPPPFKRWRTFGTETRWRSKTVDCLPRVLIICTRLYSRIYDAFRPEERGSFTPKYLRNLSTQAEKALIFIIILSTIEAGIDKVYNKIAPV